MSGPRKGRCLGSGCLLGAHPGQRGDCQSGNLGPWRSPRALFRLFRASRRCLAAKRQLRTRGVQCFAAMPGREATASYTRRAAWSGVERWKRSLTSGSDLDDFRGSSAGDLATSSPTAAGVAGDVGRGARRVSDQRTNTHTTRHPAPNSTRNECREEPDALSVDEWSSSSV